MVVVLPSMPVVGRSLVAVVQRAVPDRRVAGMVMVEGGPLVVMAIVILLIAPVGHFGERTHPVDQTPVRHAPIPDNAART